MKFGISASSALAIGLLGVPCAAVVPMPQSGSVPASALEVGPHNFSVGGVSLWYRVAGKSAGVPVIFLHGGPGEGSQVFQVFGGPELEKTERLIYFDQRGAGRSDRPKDASNYSIPRMVEDIEELRLKLGVDRIALLGHSFGATLALEYAARYSDRVAAVVAVSSTPFLLRSLDLQCARLRRDDPSAYSRAIIGLRPDAMPRCNVMRAYGGDAAKAFQLRNLFPSPTVANRVESLDNADGARNSGEAAAALFGKGLLQYRFTATQKVTAPVLIIAGGRDFQAGADPQRDLSRSLPHGRLIVYPKSGHFVFADEPKRFARDVTSFLSQATRER